MQPTLIIGRYGEIGLKANITRRFFENTLIANIKNALKKEKISFEIKRQRGRIYIYTDQIKKCLTILKNVFGITSFSPAVSTPSDIESMTKLALNLSKNKISSKTSFALKVTRTGNHNYSSKDIAVILGDAIVKKTKASVNLTKPDVKLYIEIRDKQSFFFYEKLRGTGGLPLGSQGNILAFIDSKKSILATWCVMRRGCKPIIMLSKNSMKPIVHKFLKYWYAESEIIQTKEDMTTISQNDCKAIVTGHLLSKQSLKEIQQIKQKTQLPVLTPLVHMNQIEIKQKNKEIGLTK